MKPAEAPQGFLQTIKWGAWSLLCLYLSLISGIVVGIQYDLYEPFYSTSAIDILVPFGSWFRSLHFYTSQFFLFFALIHYLVVFKKSEHYDNRSFVMLVICLPVILLLLFTGYVLRYDTTGFAAGMIAEHIIEAIPLVGSFLNRLLFSISDHGLQRVYLHHVCSFNLLFFILAWEHLRRYPVRFSQHLPFLAVVLGVCFFVGAPLDPETLGITYITGPWFFLGLQELLRYLPPLVAGVLIPLSFLGGLLVLRQNNPYFSLVLVFVCGWLALYLLFSLFALTLHG